MRNKKLIIIFSVICGFVILIILGSLIFSVRQIEVYCYNYDSEESLDEYEFPFGIVKKEALSKAILNLVEEDLKGKSVFLINDEKIAAKVNSLGYVSVINLERKFPNRVYINVKISYPYVQVKLDEGYALLDRDGKVTAIVADRVSPENIIDVTLSGPVLSYNIGEKIKLSNNDNFVLSEILTTLEKLGYEYSKAKALLKNINLSQKGNIYLETHLGVLIKLLGTNDIESKLRLAVSLFVQEPSMRYKGQITAFMNEEMGEIEASYSEKSDIK